MISNRYNYRVFWWQEDECYVAQCSEMPSISGIGDTAEEALVEARTAAAEALEWMQEAGEAIPIPFMERECKGKILLRIAPATHRLVAQRAEEEGQSVNSFLSSLIERNLFSDQIERSTNSFKTIMGEIETKYETGII